MTDHLADAQLRAVLEHAPSGLLLTDAGGRILFLNREVERLFGYPREELLGASIDRLVPPEVRAAHAGQRSGFSTTHASHAHRPLGSGRDLTGVHRDGHAIPVEVGLTRIDGGAEPLVLAAVLDIAERTRLAQEHRHLEARLRRAQQLESLGTLAGGIAHDFNNILGGILGYAELLQDQLPPGFAAREDVAAIIAAALRGRELVGRVLHVGRRHVQAPRRLDLTAVVHEVEHLLRATLPRAVSLQVSVAPRLPTVLADETAIHQVLMDLTLNAAQAMPDGGPLTIVVAPEELPPADAAREGMRAGTHVVLAVTDAGSGMDAETQARAFEPFFTTKPAGQGTGLGLALVHGIVRDHGGAVQLESRPGRGTTVRCLLPVAPEPSAASPGAAPPATAPAAVPAGRGERLLLVDDDALVRTATARRLERLGYRVQTAGGAAAALASLRAEPSGFALLITDHAMPDLTGIDLARAAHRVSPGMPVLLLSGHVEHIAPAVLAHAGIAVVLAKPATEPDLARACREAIGEEMSGAHD